MKEFLICYFLVLFFFSPKLYSQCGPDSLNMTKLYQYDDPSQSAPSGVAYNDVWGYVDTAGLEYGILGAADSIIIFNVTNQDSIYKIEAEPGDVSCIWRDMKTYDQYMYAGTECGEGILVFDLSTLPDSFSRINQITSEFTSSHNIFVDTATAHLYCVGTNGGVSRGMVIYDLFPDPANPVLLKKINLDTLPNEVPGANYYIHDIYVKNDTAYTSHGSIKAYGIWDMTNLDSVYRISPLTFLENFDNGSYVHSSWNTEDDKYAYVATEINNRQIYIVDQTDITNAVLDTTWREPLLECVGQTGSVPHNPYVVGDILYISHYQDGVQMLDITNRREPLRIGYYDLDTTNSVYNGTTSNWGVYPFLPSGTIIGSDTKNGFFALKYVPPVVPLILTQFDVSPTNRSNQAKITWDIEEAFNVQHFILERSSNGIDFEEIDLIPYRNDLKHYEIYDDNLIVGNYYYRLKMIDYDNSFAISQVRSIVISTDVSVVIYPTITQGVIHLDFSKKQNWNFSVLSSTGQVVRKGMMSNKNEILDFSSLNTGIYFIHFNSESSEFYQSFQVIH